MQPGFQSYPSTHQHATQPLSGDLRLPHIFLKVSHVIKEKSVYYFIQNLMIKNT
jgi:hypothetical protein